MHNLSFVLEQVNAAAALLTFALLIFLSFYLWDWMKYRGPTPWRTIFIGLPPAIALAAILYLEKVGTMFTRLAVWMLCLFGGSDPFTRTEAIFLMIGSVITSLGLLLMIRLLTRPRFGNWPWLASAVVTCLYVSTTTAIRIWG